MTILLAALLVASDPAVAAEQPAAAAPVAAAPAAKPAKAKKICKKEEAISGSRLASRVCLTEEEWDQRAEGMMRSSRSGYSAAPNN